ncbi:MAG: FtsX-like permease family protein [Oscillospiraceae bacterium]|jgi:putative ABC transport system permease protein|nr:FtsX-like permease family protein [Oscillospiraceae bacterium]
MKLTGRLAHSQLKENPKRTFLTLLGIILSVAMITAVFGFVASGRNAIYDVVVSQGDYHVYYGNVTQNEADTLAADSAFEKHYTESEDGQLNLYCRLKDPSIDPWTQLYDVAEKYDIKDFNAGVNTDLLALEGYAPDTYSAALFTIAGVLYLVIMIASIIAVSNSFRVSAGERTKQFGILKSVGATSKQIRSTVVKEGLMLSVIGIPIGIIVGLAVEALGNALANHFLAPLNDLNGNEFLHMSFAAPWWVIVLATVLAFVTIFLSAYLPARKAAKIPAIEAIRGSKDVKLKAKKLRTSKLTRKIFGIEGELAAKSMKRSRRSYRATVVALASSIIVFLVVNSFGHSIFVSMDMVVSGIDATSIAMLHSYPYYSDGEEIPEEYTTVDKAREITEKFKEYDKNLKIKMIGQETVENNREVDVKDILTEGKEGLYGENCPIIFLTLNDDFYKEMCKLAGVKEGENILLNQCRIQVDGKTILFTPYRKGIKSLDVQNVKHDNFTGESEILSTEKITIGGEINDVPDDLLWLTLSLGMYVITPDHPMSNIRWFVDIKDSAGFTKYAEDVLADTIPIDLKNTGYTVADIKVMQAAERGLVNLIMVFVYGFITMLTLIALTNVISTISTNITLRKREFAVLVSMGMTPKGLKRMINYESFICGLKALFFGLVIGLGLSYLIYRANIDMMVEYDYEFPVIPVISAIIAVFAVTFVTMRFSAARVRKGNIISAVRGNF